MAPMADRIMEFSKGFWFGVQWWIRPFGLMVECGAAPLGEEVLRFARTDGLPKDSNVIPFWVVH